MSSDVVKYFVSWSILKDSERGRNTDLSVFCNKNVNSRWTVTRNEKNSCSLYEIEHSSTDLQPCLQIQSNNQRHALVLKIHSVVEIQIQPSFAKK